MKKSVPPVNPEASPETDHCPLDGGVKLVQLAGSISGQGPDIPSNCVSNVSEKTVINPPPPPAAVGIISVSPPSQTVISITIGGSGSAKTVMVTIVAALSQPPVVCVIKTASVPGPISAAV